MRTERALFAHFGQRREEDRELRHEGEHATNASERAAGKEGPNGGGEHHD
jgi:hypothetical protein